jgi:nucleoside-diphosphate-sugar epimerase
MRFTIFGGSGFIGRHLSEYLRHQGMEVNTPGRGSDMPRGENLGHVIYAIGLTGNFRQRPDAAIEAHVCLLQRMFSQADFDSWLYLSSTRVYGNLPSGESAAENAKLRVSPGADSLYDLSKLLGESILLGRDDASVRVARLSNVYGAGQSTDTFLGSVLAELTATGGVVIREAPSSSKDYIAIGDAVTLLCKIAIGGRHRLYNVASGVSVTHRQLAEGLAKCGLTAEFADNAQVRTFPVIDTNRVREEFGAVSHSLLDDLPALVNGAVQELKLRR